MKRKKRETDTCLNYDLIELRNKCEEGRFSPARIKKTGHEDTKGYIINEAEEEGRGCRSGGQSAPRFRALNNMEETTFPFISFHFNDYTTDDIPQVQDIDPNVYQAVKIVTIFMFSVTFLLGVTGNGLVIWTAGFKMEKSVNIIWFLNLAIADFAFDVFLPLQITEWVMDSHWPFGQFMCKVIFTALFLNMSVSTTFLMIISLDRCTSVMCPVWSKNHKTLKMATSVSILIWTACFIFSTPYLAFFDTIHDSDSNISYCLPMYSDDDRVDEERYKAMLITRFVTMFLIPFSIIVTCYSLIVIRLRRRKSLSTYGHS
ncbi:PREDICTED: chemokine-like receptor 1 [Nanorana parkeri]|uniref:chemokine-like receptor 1 n=1 Tax=Nanorana parkeri TaxID=125878 RepID=UPI0008545BFE|nr:PREDICTED: chemokine-like receptor 1 [Nanorana parkeri]